jgi:hypothetical protein
MARALNSTTVPPPRTRWRLTLLPEHRPQRDAIAAIVNGGGVGEH